ncbi:MAG: SRPBCC family protein [Longimicrobiales bacterium]
MRTIDETTCDAPADICYRAAADVEQWPTILPHYRWVRFTRKDAFATGVVEMAAWRPFPGFKYPTWWASEMATDPVARTVTYRHIDGITKGMDVIWSVEDLGSGRSHLKIIHDWTGPRWPLIGRIAANLVIGPHFISHIAGRTLAGVAAAAERQTGSAA